MVQYKLIMMSIKELKLVKQFDFEQNKFQFIHLDNLKKQYFYKYHQKN